MMDCTIHVGIPAEVDTGPSDSAREGDHRPRWLVGSIPCTCSQNLRMWGLADSPGSEVFVRRHPIKCVIRPMIVLDLQLPINHRVGLGHLGGRVVLDVPGLVSPCRLHSLRASVRFGDFGGSTASVMPFLLHAVSNSAMNSEPPPTCTASMRNGTVAPSLSRKRAVLDAVALAAAIADPQRERRSTAVKCLTAQPPGQRVAVRVSTCTAWPGRRAIRGPRMRTACGRCVRLCLWLPRTKALTGAVRPCAPMSRITRPTVVAEMSCPSRRRMAVILPRPQAGMFRRSGADQSL